MEGSKRVIVLTAMTPVTEVSDVAVLAAMIPVTEVADVAVPVILLL